MTAHTEGSYLKCLGFLVPNKMRADILVSSRQTILPRIATFPTGRHSPGAGAWVRKLLFTKRPIKIYDHL